MTTATKKVASRKPTALTAITAPTVTISTATNTTATAPAKTSKASAKAVTTEATTAVAEAVKQKKPKLVRDSFTIPKTEYSVIDDLKQRAVKLSLSSKKSELIRAGIKALAAMSDASFAKALNAVPAIKTGRPKA